MSPHAETRSSAFSWFFFLLQSNFLSCETCRTRETRLAVSGCRYIWQSSPVFIPSSEWLERVEKSGQREGDQSAKLISIHQKRQRSNSREIIIGVGGGVKRGTVKVDLPMIRDVLWFVIKNFRGCETLNTVRTCFSCTICINGCINTSTSLAFPGILVLDFQGGRRCSLKHQNTYAMTTPNTISSEPIDNDHLALRFLFDTWNQLMINS